MYTGCNNCGSPRIEGYEHYGPTGVYAPDGGAEFRNDVGVRCLDCGTIEDAPSLFPEVYPSTLEEMLTLASEVPMGEPPAAPAYAYREAA